LANIWILIGLAELNGNNDGWILDLRTKGI
jgi:CRP-like cAMP-binding protein